MSGTGHDGEEPGEATRAVPRELDDETLVAAPRDPVADETEDADDATRVAPRGRTEDETEDSVGRSGSTLGSFSGSSGSSGSVAPPVPEPEYDSARLPRSREQERLDPARRVGHAPGVRGGGHARGLEISGYPEADEPWAPPAGASSLSTVYGARSSAPPAAPLTTDAVQRSIGPPPPEPAAPPEVVERPSMPSLERRARRQNLVTLAVFAATVAVSAVGLWLVARIAFG